MSDSTDGTPQNEKRVTSIRKIEANRRNAQKSTGPRTQRGKGYSRRNALKHGLFVREFWDFLAHGENPEKYKELLCGLYSDYRPIGTAEELLVERVAVCWWRLSRAWRHENGTNRHALRNSVNQEVAQVEARCKERNEKDAELILQLKETAKEISATGKLTEELKQKIFAMDPLCEQVWNAGEQNTDESPADEIEISEINKWSKRDENSSAVACAKVQLVIDMLNRYAWVRRHNIIEVATSRHVVPNGEVLDRILRYEAAIDRQLARTLDQLERLQRYRTAGTIPPSLTMHLEQ